MVSIYLSYSIIDEQHDSSLMESSLPIIKSSITLQECYKNILLHEQERLETIYLHLQVFIYQFTL